MTLPDRLPYPGLRAFTREESDLFFGRENCVDAMVDRLAATRFLAVLGPSGSGKSSLVRTGLLDALDLGLHSRAGSRWEIADLHPGGQPLYSLAAALLEAKGAPFDATDVDLLTAFLRRGPRSVVEWASGGNIRSGSNLLLLVDQFEELFRYGGYAQREEAEAFVSLLLESAEAPGVPIHVVITMRSEYLGACTLIPGLAERINSGLYLTPRMSREECREAITGPASVTGFKVAPDLVNRLLNDLMSFAPWEGNSSASQLERLSRRADQLPLMQHVLNQLWVRAARETGESNVELQLSDYERIGGLSGALDAHGAEVIASLSTDQARHVEGMFRALVSGSSLALAVRRPCQLKELVAVAGGDREAMVAVVEAFRAPHCNFIHTSMPSLKSDSVIVDISHESLIRQWAPLAGWLKQEARDDAEWHRLVAAQERYAQGEGGLLTGVDLHSLQAWWDSAQPNAVWSSRHGGNFDASQKFLAASRSAEEAQAEAQSRQEKRERKRLRFGVAALATALAIVTVLVIFALDQARVAKRKEIEAQKSAAKAEAEREKARLSQEREQKSAADARASAKFAQDNAVKTQALVEEISDVLYADRYNSLIGITSLQSDLMKKLIPYQSEIGRQFSASVSPASIAMNKSRLAITFELTGEAREALEQHEQAYFHGISALKMIPPGRKPTATITASLISNAYVYAWYLFDLGRDSEAKQVKDWTVQLAARYHYDPIPSELAVAYARISQLESHYYWALKQTKKSNKAIEKGIKVVRATAEASNATMEAMGLLVTLYDSLDDQDHIQIKLCDLADRMISKNSLDRRALRARIRCLEYKSRRAYVDINQGIVGARKNLEVALGVVENALRLDPGDQRLLLYAARVEINLAGYLWDAGMDVERAQHFLQASRYFVKALRGRTLLQDNTDHVKSLYKDFNGRPSFKSTEEELTFYTDILAAITPTLKAFPSARGFAYVAADAADHVGWLLYKDPQRRKESEAFLSRAIGYFEKSGAMADITSFSEDYAAVCQAYAHRAELYAEIGRVNSMVADIQKMRAVCTRALEKYPWDFYLRQHFWGSSMRAGKFLFEQKRYKEAVPYLEYASHWGVGDSSKLLALAFREGLGVAQNESRARELEEMSQKQSMESFTTEIDCGSGIKAPFIVYAREWPEGYPVGIDDQITWLKEARGCTVATDVAEAFRTLHKIARENKVPFTDLCVYAMGAATQKGKEQ